MSCGDEVVEWTNGALKIRVVAGGPDGQTEAAVESLLAEVLGIERERVRVVDGRRSRWKRVEIIDYDEALLEEQLPGRRFEKTRRARPDPAR